MKRAFQLLGIMIIILTISSCGFKKNINAKDISQAFMKELYSVDQNAVDAFPVPNSSAGLSNTTSESQRMEDAFKSLHAKLQSYVTETCLNSIVANRFYTRNIMFAIENDCTLSCDTVTLTQGQILDDYSDYNFTVEVAISFNDGSSTRIEKEKGLIAAKKEKDVWKVSFIRIDSPSAFLSK